MVLLGRQRHFHAGRCGCQRGSETSRLPFQRVVSIEASLGYIAAGLYPLGTGTVKSS